MDIRTLILARTNTVVLDPDRVAAAATRPSRDTDLDRFEDELAQLGFVTSLDLAMTIRRLPHEAIQELRGWILETLRADVPAIAAAARVPMFAGVPDAPAYARRTLTWLAARPLQPCPWCANERELGALAPCGHLVCRPCWHGGTYVGCPVCHRRVALEPFLAWDRGATGPSIVGLPNGGRLRLLFLGFDVVGVAREWLQRLVASPTPLAPDARGELEDIIDAIGPRAAAWLPRAIPRVETKAVAIARLWMVAPDRAAIARATATHLANATDVLRVAAVLMGGNASLAEPMRLRSVARGLRRAILDALDRLPADEVGEHVWRRRGLWKRVGERLHPFEDAALRPTATLAFALARGTPLASSTFGAAVQASATTIASVATVEDSLRHAAWNAPIEDGLRRGDPLLAIARLAQRPSQLLRRVAHLLRVVETRAPATLPDALAAIRSAIRRGEPRALLLLARHLRRGTDPNDLGSAIRTELVARAERLRLFPRAVVDRAIDPGVWELVAIHAAARANVIYVRDRDGGVTAFRRRELEPTATRLARVVSGGPDDGRLASVPTAEAPTWFAVVRLDGFVVPASSAGYLAQGEPHGTSFARVTLDGLIDELARV